MLESLGQSKIASRPQADHLGRRPSFRQSSGCSESTTTCRFGDGGALLAESARNDRDCCLLHGMGGRHLQFDWEPGKSERF
jgi:hypothetical protein